MGTSWIRLGTDQSPQLAQAFEQRGRRRNRSTAHKCLQRRGNPGKGPAAASDATFGGEGGASRSELDSKSLIRRRTDFSRSRLKGVSARNSRAMLYWAIEMCRSASN